MKRFQARRANGRFQRSTLENTFGLRVLVCLDCRGMTSYGVREDPPRACGQCGGARFEGEGTTASTRIEPTKETP